jgi:hypothetical protein
MFRFRCGVLGDGFLEQLRRPLQAFERLLGGVTLGGGVVQFLDNAGQFLSCWRQLWLYYTQWL